MTIGEASRKLSVFTKEHFPAVLLLPHRCLKATEAVWLASLRVPSKKEGARQCGSIYLCPTESFRVCRLGVWAILFPLPEPWPAALIPPLPGPGPMARSASVPASDPGYSEGKSGDLFCKCLFGAFYVLDIQPCTLVSPGPKTSRSELQLWTVSAMLLLDLALEYHFVPKRPIAPFPEFPCLLPWIHGVFSLFLISGSLDFKQLVPSSHLLSLIG